MNLRANLLPILAVVAGAGAAVFGLGVRPSPAVAPREIKAEPSLPPVPIPDEGEPSKSASSISGEVLERIDVEKYTYLRLGESGSSGTWTAVSSAPGVRVGDRVSVRSAELMSQFTSATLKRTFDAIYFGVLDEGRGVAPERGAVNPHAVPSAAGGQVEKVSRAKGAFGRTVAELYAERAALEGKPARVHGVVVKLVEGVLGKNFLHVKDGSGSAGNDDLAVTTSALPALGSPVLLEGTVQKDKDFGMGYRYPVLLEDARLIDE